MCGPVVTKPRSAPCPEGTHGRADAGNGGELVRGSSMGKRGSKDVMMEERSYSREWLVYHMVELYQRIVNMALIAGASIGSYAKEVLEVVIVI